MVAIAPYHVNRLARIKFQNETDWNRVREYSRNFDFFYSPNNLELFQISVQYFIFVVDLESDRALMQGEVLEIYD